MPTVTIPRPAMATEDIAAMLRAGLGDNYHVLPGMRAPRRPLARPRPGSARTIFVGTGSNRLFHAHLVISPSEDKTDVRISPGGLGWETVVNSLRIVPRVRRVLSEASIAR